MIIENYRTGCLDSGLCRYWRRHKRLKVINHEVEVKPESQGAPAAEEKETASHCHWREKGPRKQFRIWYWVQCLYSSFIFNFKFCLPRLGLWVGSNRTLGQQASKVQISDFPELPMSVQVSHSSLLSLLSGNFRYVCRERWLYPPPFLPSTHFWISINNFK